MILKPKLQNAQNKGNTTKGFRNKKIKIKLRAIFIKGKSKDKPSKEKLRNFFSKYGYSLKVKLD